MPTCLTSWSMGTNGNVTSARTFLTYKHFISSWRAAPSASNRPSNSWILFAGRSGRRNITGSRDVFSDRPVSTCAPLGSWIGFLIRRLLIYSDPPTRTTANQKLTSSYWHLFGIHTTRAVPFPLALTCRMLLGSCSGFRLPSSSGQYSRSSSNWRACRCITSPVSSCRGCKPSLIGQVDCATCPSNERSPNRSIRCCCSEHPHPWLDSACMTERWMKPNVAFCLVHRWRDNATRSVSLSTRGNAYSHWWEIYPSCACSVSSTGTSTTSRSRLCKVNFHRHARSAQLRIASMTFIFGYHSCVSVNHWFPQHKIHLVNVRLSVSLELGDRCLAQTFNTMNFFCKQARTQKFPEGGPKVFSRRFESSFLSQTVKDVRKHLVDFE